MHVRATFQLSNLRRIDVDKRQRERPGLDSRPDCGQAPLLTLKGGRQPVHCDAHRRAKRRPCQPMISASHLMHGDPGGELVWAAKRISRPLQDQQRNVDLELGSPRLLRVSRWVQRKGKREDANGTGRTRRPARYAGSAAAPADHHAKPWPLRAKQPTQMPRHRRPRDIKLGSGRRRATASHQIGLPYPGHRDSGIERGGGHCA